MANMCYCWTTGPQCCRYRREYLRPAVSHYWCKWCHNRGCQYCDRVLSPRPFYEPPFIPYFETWTSNETTAAFDNISVEYDNAVEYVEEAENGRPLRADDV